VKALWVLVFLIVYQQLENYFLAPRVTSRTMAIHPAVAFGSALIGAQLIGPLGALLALPAAAIVQAFVSTYIERYDIVKDGADEDVSGDDVAEADDVALEA